MYWTYLLFLIFVSSAFGSARDSDKYGCDLLLEATNQSYSIGQKHHHMFVIESDNELFVYKGWDVETIADDLELADHVFEMSGSRLFKANRVLETVQIPNQEVSLDVIPMATRLTYEEDFKDGQVIMMRSRFVNGRLLFRNIDEVPQARRREILEETRLFYAEAERIFNWVRSSKPVYRGIPITASLLQDIVLFEPGRGSERERSLTTKSFMFEAGENSFIVGHGQNFVIHDGKYVLVDPH